MDNEIVSSDFSHAYDNWKSQYYINKKFQNYYLGKHPMIFTAERLYDVFGRSTVSFVENWCAVVVDAVTDRLGFKGWDGNNLDTSKELFDLYTKNKLKTLSRRVHRDCVVTGNGYIMFDKVNGESTPYYQDPNNMVVIYSAEDYYKMSYALKIWRSTSGVKANLYYEDRIEKYISESDKALELALNINKYIKDYCDQLTQEMSLNWTTYATPAESTINKVIKDRKDFGLIEGVTDRDYYTNSFHVPVYYPISIARKITIEGQFHPFNNAGRISYIELSAPPIHNVEAVKTVHKHMVQSGVGYAGINFPIDECRQCNYSGIIKDVCPKCGSSEYKKIRRVSGYLGFEERINESKEAEINDRFKHDTVN